MAVASGTAVNWCAYVCMYVTNILLRTATIVKAVGEDMYLCLQLDLFQKAVTRKLRVNAISVKGVSRRVVN